MHEVDRDTIFTGNTKLGKAARILAGRIRVQKIGWQLGEGSQKAGWNVIGIGAISYIYDRTTTCTITGWLTNREAVITQGIWSSETGSHSMQDIKGVNLTKSKQVYCTSRYKTEGSLQMASVTLNIQPEDWTHFWTQVHAKTVQRREWVTSTLENMTKEGRFQS